MVETYRTFIAIELPRELRASITKHIDALRRGLPEVRASWTREENLHLTLKFLGDVSVAEIPKLCTAVETAMRGLAPFEFVVSGCGSFPAHRQPKVLWIGISDDSNCLHRLHQKLELECEKAGFSREARAFHPHLTIARLRSAKGAGRLAQLHAEQGFDSSTVEVREVLVMRSELSSAGSRYTILGRHFFGSQ